MYDIPHSTCHKIFFFFFMFVLSYYLWYTRYIYKCLKKIYRTTSLTSNRSSQYLRTVSVDPKVHRNLASGFGNDHRRRACRSTCQCMRWTPQHGRIRCRADAWVALTEGCRTLCRSRLSQPQLLSMINFHYHLCLIDICVLSSGASHRTKFSVYVVILLHLTYTHLLA